MKSRLVDTVVNNDEYLRLRIYDGEIPLAEAGAELLRLKTAQRTAERKEEQRVIAQLRAEITRLQRNLVQAGAAE